MLWLSSICKFVVLSLISRSLYGITTNQTVSRRLPTTCDVSLFSAWKDDPYTGVLAADSSFWRYQTQTDFVLRKGLALELAVASCKNRFELLKFYKAGRSGPIDIQSCYKVMCKPDCIESDRLHEEAMEISGCSCLELSTQKSSVSYHIEGDWCMENTARMLCSETGYCGVWNCRIDDFMCPKYEWYKKIIPLKGPGHCDRNSATLSRIVSIYFTLFATTLTFFVVYLIS